MAIEDYTKLSHIRHIGDVQLMSEIEYGFKSFLDWGLLGIGGWQDVVHTSGSNTAATIHNGRYDELRVVDDPQYTDRTVFEGMRKDWVWESDVNYPDGTGAENPSSVAVVSWDGAVETSYSPAQFTINYPLGRVIFDTPIADGDSVYASYAFRSVQTYVANEAEWWSEVEFNSLRPDRVTDFNQVATNEWAIGSNHRVQLPVVIIEAVPTRQSQPYEIGNNSLIIYQDVSFGILAENKLDRNNLIDILTVQDDKTIWLYDSNTVAENDDFPLNSDGSKKVDALTYPLFIEQYKSRKLYIRDAVCTSTFTPHPNLYGAIVRLRCEVIYD